MSIRKTAVICGVLGGFAIVLAGLGAARAAPITTNQPPVATLADGRAGVVAFEAPTPKSARELVERSVAVNSIITGLLKIPPGAHGPVPAMVIVHGSGGVTPGEWEWADRLNALGIATFVIDNFTGRRIEETETDQFRLSPAADVAGALAALRLLATHPGIDLKRIGVIGFSRGGIVALNTALEPFRRGVINGDLRFAAHIPFYPSCGINFVSAHPDGSPILMLLGGKDNYTPAAPCLAYADELRDKNVPISVVVYANAYHAFDRNIPLKYFPNDLARGIAAAQSISMLEPSRCAGAIPRSPVATPWPRSSSASPPGLTTVAIPRAARRRQSRSQPSSRPRSDFRLIAR